MLALFVRSSMCHNVFLPVKHLILVFPAQIFKLVSQSILYLVTRSRVGMTDVTGASCVGHTSVSRTDIR